MVMLLFATFTGIAAISTISFFLLSCSSNLEESMENVVTGEAITTAFTATITGSFNNMDNNDLMYGKIAVLYCQVSDIAGDIFESWAGGNDKPDCMIQRRGTIKSGGGYEAKIDNLKPDTQYNFCLAFEAKDGTRSIGKTSVFSTKPFNVTLNTQPALEVWFFSATLSCNVENMYEADADACTFGFLISTESGLSDNNATTFECELIDNAITLNVNNLDVNTTYHLKPYIHIAAEDRFIYGQEKSFKTKEADEMAVNLGLSVEWASVLLGATSPGNEGDLFHWGETEPAKTDKEYTYFNPSDGTFRDIGNDISGTVYDAATFKLQGKWRIPTVDEVQELIDNCELSVKKGATASENKLIIKSKKNGNTLILPSTSIMERNSKGKYIISNDGSVSFMTSTEGFTQGYKNKGFYILCSNFYLPYYASSDEKLSLYLAVKNERSSAFCILPVHSKK